LEKEEEEMAIPEILKGGEYKPKIVDEETAINEENVLKDQLA
jgi:hypothetical protein